MPLDRIIAALCVGLLSLDLIIKMVTGEMSINFLPLWLIYPAYAVAAFGLASLAWRIGRRGC